jgi:hypothetical protein
MVANLHFLSKSENRIKSKYSEAKKQLYKGCSNGYVNFFIILIVSFFLLILGGYLCSMLLFVTSGFCGG